MCLTFLQMFSDSSTCVCKSRYAARMTSGLPAGRRTAMAKWIGDFLSNLYMENGRGDLRGADAMSDG
jgi:RecB family endonuclease NucS